MVAVFSVPYVNSEPESISSVFTQSHYKPHPSCNAGITNTHPYVKINSCSSDLPPQSSGVKEFVAILEKKESDKEWTNLMFNVSPRAEYML